MQEKNIVRDEVVGRVFQNTFWLFNSSVLGRALNLLKGIILARLLFPEDFGLFGLASIIIGFTIIFSDVGAGMFLIYKHGDDKDKHNDTAFWINFFIATFLALIVVGAAPFIVKFYKQPLLLSILNVLALSLWFQIICNVHRSLLRKELKLQKIAVIDGVISIVSFLIAVLLAFRNYGVWALVLSTLVSNIINAFLIFFASGWFPKFKFLSASFKEIAPFSVWYLGSAIVWYIVFNIDNLIISKFLNMKELGLYTIAYNYALLPITLIANSFGNVVFPELARLDRNSQHFWETFYKLSRFIAFSVCPVACFLVIGAPDFFPIIFGAKWNGAIIPFQILAVYAMIRCFWIDPFGALGNFKSSFLVGLMTCILSTGGILFGLKYGIIGVAVAVLTIVGSSHIIALYISTNSFGKLLKGLQNAAPYLLTSVGAAFIAIIIRHLLISSIGGLKWLLFFVSTTTVFGIYMFVFRRNLKDIFVVIKNKT